MKIGHFYFEVPALRRRHFPRKRCIVFVQLRDFKPCFIYENTVLKTVRGVNKEEDRSLWLFSLHKVRVHPLVLSYLDHGAGSDIHVLELSLFPLKLCEGSYV